MEIHENIAWALERAGLDRGMRGPISHLRLDLDPERVTDVLKGVLPIARGFIGALRRPPPRCACGSCATKIRRRSESRTT